ncbi:MAG: hypothetical protein Q8O13_08430 [Candidatus Omnitrophota bacterium]|nr:hypothetical protein [Candidatus Omnitrophota bacterium]
MGNVLKILDVIGYWSTIIVIIAFFVECGKWFMGISPALLRLGKGLASRKIAVFAEGDDFNSLRSLLVDSKLFKEKNVTQITKCELKKAEDFSLFLAHWKSISSCLEDILSAKKDCTALVIYAPQKEGHLSSESIDKINEHRNVILVNFRGRLLNDIITSLITTSYER